MNKDMINIKAIKSDKDFNKYQHVKTFLVLENIFNESENSQYYDEFKEIIDTIGATINAERNIFSKALLDKYHPNIKLSDEEIIWEKLEIFNTDFIVDSDYTDSSHVLDYQKLLKIENIKKILSSFNYNNQDDVKKFIKNLSLYNKKIENYMNIYKGNNLKKEVLDNSSYKSLLRNLIDMITHCNDDTTFYNNWLKNSETLINRSNERLLMNLDDMTINLDIINHITKNKENYISDDINKSIYKEEMHEFIKNIELFNKKIKDNFPKELNRYFNNHNDKYQITDRLHINDSEIGLSDLNIFEELKQLLKILHKLSFSKDEKTVIETTKDIIQLNGNQGFEPTTRGFGDHCSSHWSYAPICYLPLTSLVQTEIIS